MKESTVANYYDDSITQEMIQYVFGNGSNAIGVYPSNQETLIEGVAKKHELMESMIRHINAESHVLDLGSGLGTSARYKAKNFGCRITCLDISEESNRYCEKINQEMKLADQISVVHGSVESLPFPDHSFNIAWSEETLLFSEHKAEVLSEAARVLDSQGEFIFSTLIESDNIPRSALDELQHNGRLPLNTRFETFQYYRETAKKMGFHSANILDLSRHLVPFYSRYLESVVRFREQRNLQPQEEKVFLEGVEPGLKSYINFAKKGYLKWGVFHFFKSENEVS